MTHTLIYLAAGQLLVPDRRDTKSMVKMIKEYEALMQIGVPTQFMKMLKEELEDVQIIGMSGSAPLASKTKEEFKRKSKGIAQGYGLSEMSPVTHFDTRAIYEILTGQEREDGLESPTIGIPLPDTKVKIVDVDTGDSLSWEEITKEGKEGEMCLNGPPRMRGYWDKEKEGFDEEGYVHTGDIVRVDECGRFYVVDR